MASISSIFYQCVPPFLRALNLSNQSFSFLQNSKVSIFNDHSPVIHTKHPSLPLPSFLPRNLLFGHFTSMATSTARMPSDERRHHQPSCLDQVHVHANNSLPKTSVETYVTLITVHSLSLMQTWMESEAEARLCPTPQTSMAVMSPAATAEEPSARLEGSKIYEMEITGNVPAAALFLSLALSPSPSLTPYTANAITVTGRQEMEDFISKLEEERRREVAALGELQLVSRLPFPGRIQLNVSDTVNQRLIQ